jgi:hypothetical protein
VLIVPLWYVLPIGVVLVPLAPLFL